MNKKANFLDLFVVIVVLFMFGVTSIIAYMLTTTVINTNIFDTPEANFSIQKTKSTILSFDNMLMFVIVGLSVFVIVSSAMIFNHPAFFISGMFLLFIAVIVGAIASNVFWDFTNQDTIISTANAFPKTLFLMQNLPIYLAMMGIASSIAGYVGYARQGQ